VARIPASVVMQGMPAATAEERMLELYVERALGSLGRNASVDPLPRGADTRREHDCRRKSGSQFAGTIFGGRD